MRENNFGTVVALQHVDSAAVDIAEKKAALRIPYWSLDQAETTHQLFHYVLLGLVAGVSVDGQQLG